MRVPVISGEIHVLMWRRHLFPSKDKFKRKDVKLLFFFFYIDFFSKFLVRRNCRPCRLAVQFVAPLFLVLVLLFCCHDHYAVCNNGELCFPLLTLSQVKCNRLIILNSLVSENEQQATVGAAAHNEQFNKTHSPTSPSTPPLYKLLLQWFLHTFEKQFKLRLFIIQYVSIVLFYTAEIFHLQLFAKGSGSDALDLKKRRRGQNWKGTCSRRQNVCCCLQFTVQMVHWAVWRHPKCFAKQEFMHSMHYWAQMVEQTLVIILFIEHSDMHIYVFPKRTKNKPCD